MWALIAFILLGIIVAALIEFNERRKAKHLPKDCLQEKSETENCSDCSLIEICEKKPTDAR